MRYRRARKRNIGNELFYKRYYNQKKLEYKARRGMLRGKLLDSGFYEDQTWGALGKAWLGYIISFKYDFPEIRGIVADYLEEYQDDPDVQSMSIEEIEEIMSKSDSEFWRSVRGE